MCGHVGIAGKLKFEDEKVMKSLLILDYFRGPDSTGVASIRDNNDVKVAKLASHPLDLFDTKKYSDAMNGFQSTVFIGHNRLATKGKVNGVNAHPYEYGHIVGAHNGTLEKASWDALNRILGYETDVDSQAIFAAIEKVGIEETMSHMRGAWALVWADMKEGTLNFLRNKERPFWFAWEDSLDRMFWASEWPMIEAAVAINGCTYSLYETKEGHKFWATAENWLYSLSFDDLRKGFKSKPDLRIKEIKGKEAPPVVYTAKGSDPFKRDTTTNHYGTCSKLTKTSHGTTTSLTSSEVTPPKVVDVVGYRHNPFGQALKREKFEDITKYGCSWCKKEIDWNEPGVTIYEDRHLCLCPEHSGNGDHNRVYHNPKTKAA